MEEFDDVKIKVYILHLLKILVKPISLKFRVYNLFRNDK